MSDSEPLRGDDPGDSDPAGFRAESIDCVYAGGPLVIERIAPDIQRVTEAMAIPASMMLRSQELGGQIGVAEQRWPGPIRLGLNRDESTCPHCGVADPKGCRGPNALGASCGRMKDDGFRAESPGEDWERDGSDARSSFECWYGYKDGECTYSGPFESLMALIETCGIDQIRSPLGEVYRRRPEPNLMASIRDIARGG